MKKTGIVLAVCALVALAAPARAQAAASAPKPEKKESKMVKTPSGLQYEDTKVGDGPTPEKGQTCSVHYTGWLFENGQKGKKFDSSVDRGHPYAFPLGRGRVIKGWDEGIATMKVGGKRTLLIPPDLGYASNGFPGAIPPNATLLFELELVGVK